MTEENEMRQKPDWLLHYFAPCTPFGERYRRELERRRKAQAEEVTTNGETTHKDYGIRRKSKK